MASSINLGITAIPAGTRVFAINGLPNNSSGFSLVVGRDATWLTPGTLFSLLLEIALDGVEFQEWMRCSVAGGAALDKFGQPATRWSLAGTWPGQNDGSGGRQVLRATDVRVTLTVPQSFTVVSVNLQAT